MHLILSEVKCMTKRNVYVLPADLIKHSHSLGSTFCTELQMPWIWTPLLRILRTDLKLQNQRPKPRFWLHCIITLSFFVKLNFNFVFRLSNACLRPLFGTFLVYLKFCDRNLKRQRTSCMRRQMLISVHRRKHGTYWMQLSHFKSMLKNIQELE